MTNVQLNKPLTLTFHCLHLMFKQEQRQQSDEYHQEFKIAQTVNFICSTQVFVIVLRCFGTIFRSRLQFHLRKKQL